MPLGLADDVLLFEFPDIHRDAVLEVTFHRTLRVPDDGRRHYLPPSLGRFPLTAVDDLSSETLPADWRRRGGVAMPMWPAEACWISFRSPAEYPMAVKVAAGKVNALTGAQWSNELDFAGQDYIEVPGQPWLDGFCVAKGVVRQFVAMPLGRGFTAEEQLTGRADHGGIQLLVHPMKAEVWDGRLRAAQLQERQELTSRHTRERDELDTRHKREWEELEHLHAEGRLVRHRRAAWPGAAAAYSEDSSDMVPRAFFRMAAPMGLGLGGSIRQEIRQPDEKPDVWETSARGRCFVHLASAVDWRALTGISPPTKPPSAKDYTRAGLPWFDYYDASAEPRSGTALLASLKSILTLGAEKGDQSVPEDEGFEPPEPVVLRRGRGVRPGISPQW